MCVCTEDLCHKCIVQTGQKCGRVGVWACERVSVWIFVHVSTGVCLCFVQLAARAELFSVHATLALECDKMLPCEVNVDPGRIGQVLDSALSNAGKVCGAIAAFPTLPAPAPAPAPA